MGSCFGCLSSCHGCGGGVVVVQPVVVEKHVHTTPHVVPHAANQARVTIHVAEGARLSVEGQPVAISGTSQSFLSPTLETGRDYNYEMKATIVHDGKEQAVSKRVVVRAGESVTVDLREAVATPAAPAREAAKVHVKMPREAKLFVDGVQVPVANGDRVLDTPPLEKGKPYHYTMKAELKLEGRTVTQTKHVGVEAGKAATVEFEQLTGLSAASR
jgi:uncharacterized protein (TIGR03000 family)